MREGVFAVVCVIAAACGGKSKEPAKPAEPAPAPAKLVIHTPAEPPEEVPPPREEPAGPPAFTTGVPECDAYLSTFDQMIVDCAEKLGPSVDAMKQAQTAQKDAFAQWATLEPAERDAVRAAAAPGCAQAVDALRSAVVSMGCAP